MVMAGSRISIRHNRFTIGIIGYPNSEPCSYRVEYEQALTQLGYLLALETSAVLDFLASTWAK